jgi:hypothetical protein
MHTCIATTGGSKSALIFLTRLRRQQSDPHALQLDVDDASLGDVYAFGNEVITSLLLAARKKIIFYDQNPIENSFCNF